MKRPDHLLRYAIYARVSTTDQTCETQLRDLRADRERRGGILVGEYVDTGWSGSKKSRPNLNRLIADVKAGKIDAILVWKIDRWGRNLKNFMADLDLLADHSVRFISITQGIDTADETGIGAFFLKLLVLVAELELSLIKERTAASRMRRMTDDKPDSWCLPLPFGVKDGFPYLKPALVQLVNRIFEWREMEKSVYQIEKLLAAEGARSKRGNHIGIEAILKLLRSRCMITEYKRGGKKYAIKDREGNLLRVVSDARFQRVQNMMKDVKARKVGRPSELYLLTGWVHCHKCGSRCHGVKTTNSQRKGWEKLYYRCNRNSNQKRAAIFCKGSYLNAPHTDNAVWDEVWHNVLMDPENLRSMGLAKVAEDEKARANQRDPRKLLKARYADIKRIQTGHKAGVYNDAEAALEIKPLREQIEELEAEARLMGKVVEIAPIDRVAQVCAKIAGGKEPKILAARRLVLEQLLNLKVVRVAKDMVEISGEVPMVAAEENLTLAGNSRKKNSQLELAGVDNSFAPIPFRLLRKVA